MDPRSQRSLWKLFWGMAVSSVILDQASKWAALHYLDPANPVPILPGLFDLQLVFNPGAAFSMFQGARWMFILVSGLAVVFLPWYLASLFRQGETDWVHPAGLGLVMGGAVGNAIDRIFRHEGLVVDFFHAFWRDRHFPVFNVADSAITVGIGLLLIWSLFGATTKNVKTVDSEGGLSGSTE